MRKHNYLSFAVISVVSLLSTFFVHADTLKADFTQCITIKANTARLACFDNLSLTLTTTPTTTTHHHIADVVTDKKITSVVTTVANKDDNFGAEHLKSKSNNKEVVQAIFTIKKFKKDAHGRLRFTFQNGQYWKQTDSNYFKAKIGDSVILKKGVLGAFYLKKNSNNSNRSIRVKRLK